MKITFCRSAFNELGWRFLNDTHPTQIFYGGASAGKSYFIAQRLIHDLIKGGRNYLVARNVGRTNRQSTFTQVLQILDQWNLTPLFHINRTELIITAINGYQAIFVGLDDPEKLKSVVPRKGVLTDIWIEEATEISEDAYKQLERRLRGVSSVPKRITMTFNPIYKGHWIYDKFFKGVPEDKKIYEADDLLIVHMTYKDNKFLTTQDVLLLEREEDPYFRDVYTLGRWGVLGDLIFTNWTVVDLDEYDPTCDIIRYGLDFGYADSPAAFVEAGLNFRRKEIYIFSEIYERGLTNPELAELIKPVCRDNPVACDSSEPKSIAELRECGINAFPASKGKDSVLYGVQWLRQFRVFINSTCQNAVNEFSTYQWQKDRDGNALPRPVKRNDHLIDAIRYAFSLDMEARHAGVW